MSKIFETIKTKLNQFKYSDYIEDGKTIYLGLEYRYAHQAVELLAKDKDLAFKVLTDITALDYPGADKRFVIIYNLLSLANNTRIIIKVAIDEDQHVDSISDIYKGAVWYEREVWDMFGIIFNGLSDHRRILTDYGFEGHPLRKDFPVTGFKEVRYDLEQKKVVYEPVSLQQEFRVFDNLSPWEGTNFTLPGDEKAKG